MAKPKEKEKQPQPEAATGTAVTTIDFAADAGKGIEGADRDSFAIPFLAVLQPLSPQVDAVKDAKAGMLLNTVTNETYDAPIIIPCAFQRRWVRWGAREAGGGFKGEFTTAQVNELREKSLVKDLEGRLYFPEQDGSVNPKRSDRLADTRNHYVLLLRSASDALGTPIVFALTSTGIRVSKNFMSRIDSRKVIVPGKPPLNAPSFSAMYTVTTELKTNEKGKWWQPIITPLSDVTNGALYAMAREFYQQVTAGRVRAAHETAQPEGENLDDERV